MQAQTFVLSIWAYPIRTLNLFACIIAYMLINFRRAYCDESLCQVDLDASALAVSNVCNESQRNMSMSLTPHHDSGRAVCYPTLPAR